MKGGIGIGATFCSSGATSVIDMIAWEMSVVWAVYKSESRL